MFGSKIGMKYGISVSENPFTKFHLNPFKTEKLVKSWTLTPNSITKNDLISGTNDNVINSITVLDRIYDILAHYQTLFQLTFKQWK